VKFEAPLFLKLNKTMNDQRDMKRYFTEALGTFFLVFAGAGAIVINAESGGDVTHVGIALTFGLIVTSLIYAIGDISGAHINPAVTIGFWAAKRFPARDVAPYLACQCVGAILASATLRLLFWDQEEAGATTPSGSWAQTAVLEVLLTFLLMYVILCVSTGAKEKGIMAGVAIGGVVALEAMFAGPITGASMNPARSLGPAIFGGELSSLWIYLVAPTIGALLAVGACRCSQPSECCGGSVPCEQKTSD